MDFKLKLGKFRGHKWLLVDYQGFRTAEICIDNCFNSLHYDDVTCATVPGWLPLSGFSYFVDSVGNYCLHVPTCYGFHSTRNGRLRTTGEFHSYVVLRPHFFECVKSYIFS